MLVQIPDDVALRYQAAADAARQPLQRVLERQLSKFAGVPTTGRVLVLTGEPLAEAEQILGLGSTASADALLAALRSHAGITIGDIRIPFSPAQLAEIQHRAKVQDKTPEAIVQGIVDDMAKDFFYTPVVAR